MSCSTTMSEKNSKKPGLTEGSLARHNQDSTKTRDSKAPDSWAHRVVAEERIHLYHSQLALSRIRPDQTGSPTDREMFTENQLKIFQERPLDLSSPEGPLERFLTPDGCSDPWYYARPALETTQIVFGSMESVDERRLRARANMELVAKSKKEKKERKKKSNE